MACLHANRLSGGKIDQLSHTSNTLVTLCFMLSAEIRPSVRIASRHDVSTPGSRFSMLLRNIAVFGYAADALCKISETR